MRTANLTSVVEVIDALEGTRTAAWGWDVAQDLIRWSPNTGPLYGRPRGYQPESYEAFLALVHPDDRDMVADAVRAAIEHQKDYEVDLRGVWPDGTTRWLRARAHAVTDEDGATARIVGVLSDITESKRRADENAFLAEAGELLASSLDVQLTLGHVADLLVRHLVDWCSVQLVDGGKLRTAKVAHRDLEMVLLASQLEAQYPPPPDPEGPTAEVLATGQTVIVPDITDEMLISAAVDERHLDLLRSLGLAAAMSVPLKARGQVLGVMTLVWTEPRGDLQGEVTFAEEFGRRAGLALDNARLVEETESSRRVAERRSLELTVLYDVIAELSRAVDLSDVADVGIRMGIKALGADRGAVVIAADSGPTLVGSVGYSAEQIAGFSRLLDQPGPLSEAMGTGHPVHCSSVDEMTDRYPNLVEAMSGVSAGAFAAIPLRTAGGLNGAIGFVYEKSKEFSDDERALMAALAQHTSVAVERGILFERNRTVAQELQAALSPSPEVHREGIPATAWYRPAGVGGIGGDWYDVIDTPRGTHIYVMGDVVGRGLQAVATMAQLRHSLRMLLLDGRRPEDALRSLSLVTTVDATALCATVLCVEVDPQSHRLEVSSAGHLPPALVTSTGSRLVPVQAGPPLGLTSHYPRACSVEVGAQDVLVIYTDGVVERRDRTIDESFELLTTTLDAAGPQPEAIASALISLAGDADDDATFVIMGPRS